MRYASQLAASLLAIALHIGTAGQSASDAPEKDTQRPLHLALLGPPARVERMFPHLYDGGFSVKTMIFETLVRRNAHGEIVPGLASAWTTLDEGRALELTLRDDRVFHDDRPVDAAVVRWNFLCWIHRSEHLWLPAARRIQEVELVAYDRLRITMDRPYALLADLCATNPPAILSPSSVSAEGAYVQPIGSGPFRFLKAEDEGHLLHYERFVENGDRPARKLEVHVFEEARADEAVQAILDGDIDLMVDTWVTHAPRARLDALREDARIDVHEAPGSPLMVLQFNLRNGPMAERSARAHVRSLIDRDELIRTIEHGHAAPCTSYVADTITIWPRSRAEDRTERGEAPPATREAPLRLLIEEGKPRATELAPALVAQLERAGLPTVITFLPRDEHDHAVNEGRYDMRLTRTWGLPYDPHLTLMDRFLPPWWADPEDGGVEAVTPGPLEKAMQDLVREAMATPELEARSAVYGRIQSFMDREVVVVPLYVAHRVALVRAGLAPPELGPDYYRLDLDPVIESLPR